MGHKATAKLSGDGETALPAAPPYEMERLLGQGGIADVYLATDLHLKCQVAIKQLRSPVHHDLLGNAQQEPQRADVIERFVREWQAMGQLNHPHIVRARSAGLNQGKPYLVMDYMPGGDIESHIREFGLPSLKQACVWMKQACQGLDYAHECGWVHRDLKPANLLLDHAGDVKLSDFGIAYCGQTVEERVTLPGVMMGTPDFIAPEQITDFSKAGPAADLYSLGCTFFQILFGDPPYGRSLSLPETLHAHQQGTLTFPWHLRHEPLPAQQRIERLLRRMMAKQPQDRHASVKQVQEEIDSILEVGMSWHHSPSDSWTTEIKPLHWILVAVAAVALFGLGFGGVMTIRYLSTNRSERVVDLVEDFGAEPIPSKTFPKETQDLPALPAGNESTQANAEEDSEPQDEANWQEPELASLKPDNAIDVAVDEPDLRTLDSTENGVASDRGNGSLRTDFGLEVQILNGTYFSHRLPVRFSCDAELDCALFLLVIGENQADGMKNIDLLVPNPKIEKCLVTAQQSVFVPGQNDFFRMQVPGIPGHQKLLAIGVRQSVQGTSDASLLPSSRDVKGLLEQVDHDSDRDVCQQVVDLFQQRWNFSELSADVLDFETY